MRYGVGAFELTGTPLGHGEAIQLVADQMQHGILFRAVGSHCTRLLEESYAAKGFRIDTKSCDWGPMRGFVCVDPRLSKAGLGKGEADNRRYTTEALHGGIRHDAIGGLDLRLKPDGFADLAATHLAAEKAEWTAGCKPLVISAARVAELLAGDHISIIRRESDGQLSGVSTFGAATAQVRFPWRLIPAFKCKATRAFDTACHNAPNDGFGIFVDVRGGPGTGGFAQELPAGTDHIRVFGYDALLGLTNPGTDQLGYRACVTGDYDMFGVWPPAEEARSQTHFRPSAFDLVRARRGLGSGRMTQGLQDRTWDGRYVEQFSNMHDAHHHQHYQVGNITRRLNLIKTQLNTTLQSVGGYQGGALVHHSDEVGNPSPGLVKSLEQSMPIIAFLPGSTRAFGVENPLPDFQELVRRGVTKGLMPDLRKEWLPMLPSAPRPRA